MMDRNCIAGPGLYGVRTSLVLATYAALLCIAPLVVCRPDTEMTSFEPWGQVHTEILSDQNPNPIAHHKKKHHKNNRIDEDLPNSVKQWGERKKKIRSRSKPIKSKFSEDYDEMAEKRVTKEANIINNLKYLESDKKYFDYFPIEDVELNYDPKEDDIRVVVLSSSDDDDDIKKKKSKKFTRSMKKQRSKRDTAQRTDDGKSITKRNIYIDAFIQSLLGNNIPRANSNIRRQALNYPGSSNIADGYPSQHTRNDPWDNRFTSALNNFFLPVPQPVYPSSPVFVKYPIQGIYYNPISPPRGYIPQRPPRPNTPPTAGPILPTTIDSRFGAEDDHVVWDVVPDKQAPSSNQPSGEDEQPPSTRKPAPPLFHAPVGGGNRAVSRPTTSTTPPPTEQPPSTRRPAPPLIHGPIRQATRSTPKPTPAPTDSFDIRTSRAPQEPPRRQEEPEISPPPLNFPQPLEPSRCVWAIVTCCARNNLAIRYACFEEIGCHGAFWDYNPCADQVQDAALGEATRFFD